MQKKNRKNIIILGLLIFTVFFTVIGGSYAFFSVIFQDTRNNENSSFTTDNLSNATIVSNIPNGVGSFLSTDIYPGHKEVLGLSVTGSGEVNSKSYFQFKYKVSENGLGSNVKISVYRSGKPIEITKNHFNCIKKNEKIENTSDTKYFEICEEKDLGLLLEETTLNGGAEEIVIGKDTLTIKNENEDVTKYYYVVVEFVNKEESQNELMNRSLAGKVEVELTTPFVVDYTNNIEGIATSKNESYQKQEIFSIHVTSEKYRLVSMSEDNKSWEDLPEKSKDITIEKTVTENGTYNYYFQDEAENVQEVVMEATKVDTEPPTLNVTAEEYLNGIKVDASKSSDSKSKIKAYSYKLNEGEYIESTDSIYTFTGLSDGDYKVTVKLEDNAGNISNEKEMDVTMAYENVYISSSGNDESGNGSETKPYASLQRAYNKVKSGGSMILQSNITATSTTTMNIANKNITLKSNGTNKYTITKENNLTTQILYLTNSNNLTTNNVIFDGDNIESTGSLIEGFTSTITLNNTTVQNNINNGRTYTEWNVNFATGGGVLISDGTLTINEGTLIQNNKINHSTSSSGGGVSSFNSTIKLKGGNISQNKVTGGGGHGGGINLSDSQLFMTGGLIDNNIGTYGGGISLWDSDFTMEGGQIFQNTALDSGGGVWMLSNEKDSTSNIIEGKIYNNTATEYGGGILLSQNNANFQAKAYVKAGTIENNTAPTGPNTHTWNGAEIKNN